MIGSLLVGVSLACLAVVAAYIALWLDRCGREAAWRLLGAVAWGVVTGGVWSAVLRPQAAALVPARATTAAALAASAAAAVLLIGLLRLAPGEGLLDGVAHGVAAGAGLGLLGGGLPPGATFAAMVGAALTAGAVAGVGTGLAALEPRLPRKLVVLIPAAALSAAVLVGVPVLLALPGARDDVRVTAAAAAAGAVLAALVAIAAGAGDGHVLRRELSEEAALGVLPEWAAALAPSYRRRIRAAWWADADERRAVNRLLLRLAVRKRRIERLDESRGRVAGLEVGRMRDRLRRLFSPIEDGED